MIPMLCRRRIQGLVAVVAALALATSVCAQVSDKTRPAQRPPAKVQTPKQVKSAPRTPAQRPAAPSQKRSVAMPLQTQPGTERLESAGKSGFLLMVGGALTTGFVASGLVGLGLGHGFGGLAGVPGLLAQLALAALILWLLARAFRRVAPDYGLGRLKTHLPHGVNRPAPRLDPMRTPRLKREVERPAAADEDENAPGSPGPRPLRIGQSDMEEFEWLLGVVQTAYGREDLDALGNRVTPRLHTYLADAVAVNASNGLINRISDVRLINATLSEALTEGDWDYARVAMHFEARDVLQDRISGVVIRGHPDERVEMTEVWIFKRQRHGRERGPWIVAGIRPV